MVRYVVNFIMWCRAGRSRHSLGFPCAFGKRVERPKSLKFREIGLAGNSTGGWENERPGDQLVLEGSSAST